MNEIRGNSLPDTGYHAQGITKWFITGGRRLEVLTGVDIHVLEGEMIAITGASGTGKTTLLHILGALDKPDSGSLIYRGEDVFQKNDNELSLFRNHTVGFVFQAHHLLPEFSAIENVMMPGLISGEERKQLNDYAAELLDKVGLSDRTKHRIGELSGGEQQRVALARAIVMKPAFLLADEPTGNLDSKTGDRIFDLILEMNSAFSLSTVMVTHNLDLAKRMDRCLILRDGTLGMMNAE
ncbi:MAG: ABC transporter ATP-binding protein [Thermodesulfobacteriota bacterium]|nr:ABC transporter ATP-binding protein [Thermodesulfobacteriota bacterium]